MATKKRTTKKEAEVKPVTGVVTGGALNVRSLAGLDGEVTRVLKDGETIYIIEAGDEWHRIKDGYVMARWVRLNAGED